MKVSSKIADRKNVFYWQTDRDIEPKIAGMIWKDRHGYFTDDELLLMINDYLTGEKLAEIYPLDLDAQTNLGNVNSVRVGKLTTGKEVIIRCHPKGVPNGYFHAEALASQTAKDAHLPSYSTLAIHTPENEDDFAFHVIEKLPGTAVKFWLNAHPQDEEALLIQIGKMMANIHKIKVEGFGPFDNEKAKSGKLTGLHNTQGSSIRAGLEFNVDVLKKEGLFTLSQGEEILTLFSDENPLLHGSSPVLIHNDFADWNLLTDGKEVTGILDWDESVAGDPILDVACWSTFFEPSRLQKFLEGYFDEADKPNDFQEKFELFRLRYTLSKMTLRLRKYTWDPSEFALKMIQAGRLHLAESLDHFKI